MYHIIYILIIHKIYHIFYFNTSFYFIFFYFILKVFTLSIKKISTNYLLKTCVDQHMIYFVDGEEVILLDVKYLIECIYSVVKCNLIYFKIHVKRMRPIKLPNFISTTPKNNPSFILSLLHQAT